MGAKSYPLSNSNASKKRKYNYTCPDCKNKLQKWGKTKAGAQRWRCPNCSNTNTKPRQDLTKKLLLQRFIKWLLGKQSQVELNHGLTDRAWRKQIEWCWGIIPRPKVNSIPETILLIDATRVGNQVCFIARNTKHIINWLWFSHEYSFPWEMLFKIIPEPLVIVCDGQKGMLIAIARTYHNVHIQRCLNHVRMNLQVKLTRNPQTQAGIDLKYHFKTIWEVKTLDQADQWIKQFKLIYTKHFEFLKQRTYLDKPRINQRKWWYTHRSVRSAYRQIDKLIKNQQLFTYLDEKLLKQVDQPIPKTTNYLEGGINSQLKHLLRIHRGLNQTHEQRLVDWYLYSKSTSQKRKKSN